MQQPGAVYRYSRAIVRPPADTVAGGLRAADKGDPDVSLFRTEHDSYCNALEGAGLEIVRLPQLPAYPDSVFVEDPALVLPEGAVLLRPGTASRAGEGEHLVPTLEAFRPLVRLPQGHVDGGDILVTAREVVVGLSGRTDAEGFEALQAILSRWGYTARRVTLPAGLLHLKTGCSLLDDTTVLVTADLAASGLFGGYDLVVLPDGEAAAANAIRVNDRVLVPAGFPRTAGLLADLDYDVIEVATSQAALLDGGLSCLSLRF